MGTVKAGYLHKLSGFFKNTWKRRYFVLYQDGVFCYYQDAKDKESDGKIHMKTECRRIQVGNAVGEGVKPPKNIDTNALFSVSSPERTWYLYAETESEGREWISALEQSRAPVAYSSQNASVGSAYPPAYNVQSTPVGHGYPVAIGFNPSVTQAVPPAAPPPYPHGPPQSQPAYGQQPPGYAPPPYRQPYPPQVTGGYPQQPHYHPPQVPGGYPQQAHYHPPQVPGGYPQQAHYHPPQVPGGYPQQATGPQVQYPQQPYYPVHGTTTYVQQPTQQRGGRNRMLMGAAAGLAGGAAMGYMLGNTVGGFGHHGFGGWGSDHSWSSGGSFDCDFD